VNLFEVLKFIGLPVLFATAVVFCSWSVFTSKRLQPLGDVLAIGIAAVTAFVLQEGIPSVPPSEKWHWLIITTAIIAIFACLYVLFSKWDKGIILQAIIAGFIAAVFMQFPNQSGLFERLFIFFMVLFVSVGLRRTTIPAWHMFIVSWSALACISILALHASFAKLAFFTGAMSAVAATLFVLQRIKPRGTKSVQMLFGVLIVGCAMCGVAYDPSRAVPLFAWFLPMVGILLASTTYFLYKPKYRTVFSIAILELCLLISVVWTLAQATPQDEMWP
jgi:hypothetical protein